MKALSELLKAVKPLTVEGSCDVEIAGVEIDSRKVKQGDLFVAMKGTHCLLYTSPSPRDS